MLFQHNFQCSGVGEEFAHIQYSVVVNGQGFSIVQAQFSFFDRGPGYERLATDVRQNS